MMHKRVYSVAIVALIPMLILALQPAPATAGTGQSATFINVGQGDSALLQDGNGFDVLIDGGRTSAGPTVLSYLRQQRITNLDAIVASHADSDRIGGLIDVLEA